MKPVLFKVHHIQEFIEANGLTFCTSLNEVLQVINGAPADEYDTVLTLVDAVSCKVAEERNGAYELVMQYPITGAYYSEIELNAIIAAKPNPTADVQQFRINKITKPMNGIVTVFGYHISYDLAGYPVKPFSASSVTAALNGLVSNSAVPCPFSVWTDKSTTAAFRNKVPTSFRALLGGNEGSVLDVYGGEYEFDNFTIKLHNNRGADRGVNIRYGKNLVDLEQEENCANVYTGVYPYWADEESGVIVQLDEGVVPVEGNYGHTRILTLDFSDAWEDAPTKEQLRARAKSYITANKIGVPKVSLKVSFVQLEKSEEYKGMALLERVDLCDTVSVLFEKLGVSATAKCIKTEYNVLLERYESIELGEARSNLTTTMAAQAEKLEQVPTTSAMERAITSATNAITGNSGGYVVMHSSEVGAEPDEILVMDTPSIETATKVWRWNKQGLGYSSRGYAGPYGLAMTADGAIVADFITTGNLNAALITAGVIANAANTSFFDLDGGRFYTKLGNFFAEAIGYSFNINANGNVMSSLTCADNGTGGLLNFHDVNGALAMQLNNTGLNFWNPATGNTILSLNANGVYWHDTSNRERMSITTSGFSTKNTSGTEIATITSGGVTINGKTYAPMNIDYKDGRGESKTMQILCAGIT